MFQSKYSYELTEYGKTIKLATHSREILPELVVSGGIPCVEKCTYKYWIVTMLERNQDFQGNPGQRSV